MHAAALHLDPPARPDIVVVGGGIAGGALATVLARGGLEVLLLERDVESPDRNRGELLMPWGWADADHLGLAAVLDGAAGQPNTTWAVADPDDVVHEVPVGQLHPVAPGSYSISHPAACEALRAAASAAGAHVRLGVTGVEVRPGDSPTVTWNEDGQVYTAAPRIVVGADGRNSAVRRQLGLELHRTPRTHVISTVLVEGTTGLSDTVYLIGRDERLHLVVPLSDDRVRLYSVSRGENHSGLEGALEIIAATQACRAPDPARWAGTPAGPASTFGGEDGWLDRVAADPCVLIGDAAGYNSPIIGQGLSLALRDVRLVSDALLAERPNTWTASLFDAYDAERVERLRRARIVAQLWAEARLAPDHRVVELRNNPLVQQLMVGLLVGLDDADPELFSPASAIALAGDAGAEVLAAVDSSAARSAAR